MMCECPKCGNNNVEVQINEEQIRSFYHCSNCGNEWSRAGINRKGENTPKAKNPYIIPIICLLGVLLMIVFAFSGENPAATTDKNNLERNVTVSTEEGPANNIKGLEFTEQDDVTVKIEENSSPGYLNVSVESIGDFHAEDINFISKNPDIATIKYTKAGDWIGSHLYFQITGVSSGETDVYAISKDGSIKSGSIHVIVQEPIQIESIAVGEVKKDLIIGENISVEAVISPEDAEDKTLTWKSSDDAVVTVDPEGNVGHITAVGGGEATITISSANDVTSSFDLNVDGTKTLMHIRTNHKREDDNNIGDEWDFDIEINGERAPNTMGVAVGDTIDFSAKITENDDVPDVGTGSASHTVTADDIVNGFEVSFDVYAKENAGRNSGKSAHFIVTYSFSPN